MEPEIAQLVSQAKRARFEGDRESELAIWNQIDQNAATRHPQLLLQLGSVLVSNERYDRAAALLAEMKSTDPDGRPYRILLIEYLASRDRIAELIDHLSAWVEAPSHAVDLINIVEAAWTYTGHPAVFGVLKRACLKAAPEFDAVATGAIYHVLNPTEALDERNRFNFSLQQLRLLSGMIEALIDQGHRGAAQSVISSVRRSLSGNDTITAKFFSLLTELAAIGKAWVEESNLVRPIINEDFTKDVIVSEPGRSGKLAIVFSGWNGRPLVGSRILDNQLASLGYQTVFLRDANSVGYGRGIRSLGESRSETLRAIEKLISRLGAVDPLIIGTSIGTFGAVSHGLPLGIRKLALFGPVAAAGDRTFLHSLGDFRGGVLLNRTSKMIPEGERLMSDFFQRARHKFRINVIVGDGDQQDINYANSIAHHDGVKITKITDFSEHNSLRPAISRGLFRTFIEQDLL